MSIKKLSKPPGIEDIFPDRSQKWDFILNTAEEVFNLYNYKKIILPVLEYTELFIRGIGSDTDIVSKEMFTLEDRGGRNLSLRPEGTASVVRAYIENGDYNRLSSCKFFYHGPMFRAERPQRGRLRQFNQFGAETFGSINPFYDFEIISMMNIISERVGISDFSLLINSIGCADCRHSYVEKLKAYYQDQSENLCNDCGMRLHKNPLRLLDCKKQSCDELKNGAPKISDYLCGDCREHYEALKELLFINSIDFTEDPYLVRGLDYYTKTTFEFVSNALGGQNAFAAGGRYDNLVQTFGGKPTPAVGFAAGVERIFLLIENMEILTNSIDVFLVYSGEEAFNKAVELAGMLRSNNISADIDPNSKGLKSQFKKADRESAKYSIIIGDNEITEGKYTLKNMKTGEQTSVDKDKILALLNSILNE